MRPAYKSDNEEADMMSSEVNEPMVDSIRVVRLILRRPLLEMKTLTGLRID